MHPWRSIFTAGLAAACSAQGCFREAMAHGSAAAVCGVRGVRGVLPLFRTSREQLHSPRGQKLVALHFPLLLGVAAFLFSSPYYGKFSLGQTRSLPPAPLKQELPELKPPGHCSSAVVPRSWGFYYCTREAGRELTGLGDVRKVGAGPHRMLRTHQGTPSRLSGRSRVRGWVSGAGPGLAGALPPGEQIERTRARLRHADPGGTSEALPQPMRGPPGNRLKPAYSTRVRTGAGGNPAQEQAGELNRTSGAGQTAAPRVTGPRLSGISRVPRLALQPRPWEHAPLGGPRPQTPAPRPRLWLPWRGQAHGPAPGGGGSSGRCPCSAAVSGEGSAARGHVLLAGSPRALRTPPCVLVSPAGARKQKSE